MARYFFIVFFLFLFGTVMGQEMQFRTNSRLLFGTSKERSASIWVRDIDKKTGKKIDGH